MGYYTHSIFSYGGFLSHGGYPKSSSIFMGFSMNYTIQQLGYLYGHLHRCSTRSWPSPQVTLSPSTSRDANSVQASEALISALSRKACIPGTQRMGTSWQRMRFIGMIYNNHSYIIFEKKQVIQNNADIGLYL